MTTAAEAEERCANLVILCTRLGAMLADETKAFEARRPMDVQAGQAETQKLANLYRHESLRIRQDPGLVAAASAPARRRLMAAVQGFEVILARHGRAVYAAKTVSEGLVQALATEIAAHRTQVATYGPGARSGKGSATAITLNKRA
jgi:hypothetical protein